MDVQLAHASMALHFTMKVTCLALLHLRQLIIKQEWDPGKTRWEPCLLSRRSCIAGQIATFPSAR